MLQHHLYADLLHAQIFGDNLLDDVAVQAQLTCDQLHNQPIIFMHHLPHALLRPSTPGFVFHVLASLFKVLVPLKILEVQHLHTHPAVVQVLQVTSGWFGTPCPSLGRIKLTSC